MIYTICSGYLVAATTKRKKDALLLTWLQEEVRVEFYKLDILNKEKIILVFEDNIDSSCPQVIEPTVFDEAELSVYEELWDSARMITDKVCSD